VGVADNFMAFFQKDGKQFFIRIIFARLGWRWRCFALLGFIRLARWCWCWCWCFAWRGAVDSFKRLF